MTRSRPVLVIRLRADDGMSNAIWRGLRMLLKRVWRLYGLRCIELRQEYE